MALKTSPAEVDISKDQMHYADRARERERVWNATVGKVMFSGSTTGYISRDLGDVDPRPELTDEGRELLMVHCRARTDQTFPDEQTQVDGLPEAMEHIFSDHFTADVDDLQEAILFLGLDLDDAGLGRDMTLPISPHSTLRLRVDQIQNVAFMVKKAEGTLRGCINGNDCGTGKTIETLAAINFLAMRRARQPALKPEGQKHKPVIILCPPKALASWRRDHSRFFTTLLDLVDASAMEEADIVRQVLALDSADPRTSKRVYLVHLAARLGVT